MATPELLSGWPARKGLTRLDLSRQDRPAESAWLHSAPAEAYDDLIGRLPAILTEAEQADFAAFGFERRKRSWLLGRYAAKRAAAAYLGIDPEALHRLEVVRGVFGQPLLRFAHCDAPRLGISHTSGWAVGLAHPPGHPLAIDLEDVHTAHRAAIVRQLSEEERLWTDSAPGGEPEPGLLTLLWTAREALSKAVGCGLTVPFHLMETTERTYLADRRFRGLFRRFGQYQFRSWIDDATVLSLVLPRLTEVTAVAEP